MFSHDLQRHRKEDLFHVQLQPQSVSLRDADIKLRSAILAEEAEYLGWLVVGDEILVQPPVKRGNDAIYRFLEEYPSALRWRLSGFYEPTKLRLRPRLMAAEGMPGAAPAAVSKILAGSGWIASVNVLFAEWDAVVIRRDALGRVRHDDRGSGLPTTWTVE